MIKGIVTTLVWSTAIFAIGALNFVDAWIFNAVMYGSCIVLALSTKLSSVNKIAAVICILHGLDHCVWIFINSNKGLDPDIKQWPDLLVHLTMFLVWYFGFFQKSDLFKSYTKLTQTQISRVCVVFVLCHVATIITAPFVEGEHNLWHTNLGALYSYFLIVFPTLSSTLFVCGIFCDSWIIKEENDKEKEFANCKSLYGLNILMTLAMFVALVYYDRNSSGQIIKIISAFRFFEAYFMVAMVMICVYERANVTLQIFTAVNVRILILGIAIIVHSLIAWITFNHVKDDFADYKMESSYVFDLMLQVLYLTTIDATLGVLQLNRGGIRLWHWKVNTAIAVSCIIAYYSNWKLLHFSLLIAGFAFIYKRLKKEKIVCKVGLSKYVKTDTDMDYHDISMKRNARYVFITFCEAFLLYNHKVFFLSPLLFIIIDAVWNRIINQPRTKLSDFYVSIFTASMDTGLWMALFNVEYQCNIMIDVLALVLYAAIIEVLVYFNDDLIKDCYSILNNKRRWLFLIGWTLCGVLLGSFKHQFAIFFANLTANMLFTYIAGDIVKPVAQMYLFDANK